MTNAEEHRLVGNSDLPGRSEAHQGADLRADIERLARASVLVLGDATLERRVLGRFDGSEAPVDRVHTPAVPTNGEERPGAFGPRHTGPDSGRLLGGVPEFRLGTEEAEPGGGGSIVRALADFGVATAFICVLGDDLAGAELTALIGAQSNVEPWLLVDAVKATTTETRYVAWAGEALPPSVADGLAVKPLAGANALAVKPQAGPPQGGAPPNPAAPERVVLRTIREDGRPINAKLRARMLRIAGDAMAATSVTVLCDRGHGTLDMETTTEILARSRQAGRRVVADLERMRGIEHRFHGFDAIVGIAPGGDARDAAPADEAVALRRDAEIGAAVLFLPEGGALLADRDGVEQVGFVLEGGTAPGYARFVAAFAGAMAVGRSLRHALHVAGFAAGLAAREGAIRPGATQPGAAAAAVPG